MSRKPEGDDWRNMITTGFTQLAEPLPCSMPTPASDDDGDPILRAGWWCNTPASVAIIAAMVDNTGRFSMQPICRDHAMELARGYLGSAGVEPSVEQGEGTREQTVDEQ